MFQSCASYALLPWMALSNASMIVFSLPDSSTAGLGLLHLLAFQSFVSCYNVARKIDIYGKNELALLCGSCLAVGEGVICMHQDQKFKTDVMKGFEILFFLSFNLEQSQMEFSVASLSIQEQGGAQLQNEQRQPLKAAPGVQVPKPPQAAKTPGSDGLIAPRKDEESSFWKINAERSKFEGDKSEFQSLTPSQIKSMEKGEKPLPSFCRQESAPKEVVKAEKPSVTKPEKSVAPSLPSVSLEWEKPRPSQLPASSLDDFFLPDPPQYLASSRTNKEDNDGTILSDPQTPGQVRTAVSTILKFKNKYNTLKYDKVILEDQEFHKH